MNRYFAIRHPEKLSIPRSIDSPPPPNPSINGGEFTIEIHLFDTLPQLWGSKEGAEAAHK